MREWSDLHTFFVKEHVGLFKAANNYDICDPEDGRMVLACREERLGIFTKLLRFTDYKRMTPFEIIIRDADNRQVLRVRRGVSLLLSKVQVFDADDQPIGGFKQKLFSIGGAFTVLDAEERPVCKLKGRWTGWDFRFLDEDERELAHVTKKWAGIGKELFSSADNYVLDIYHDVGADSVTGRLIIAAVMCIDMVLKE